MLKSKKSPLSLQLAFLVAGAKLGDQKAANALVNHCHKKFIAHGWRLTGDKDAAEDVVQQSWVEILRSLQRLNDDHLFLPWGYRIVTRMAARWIKRQQKRRLIASTLTDEQLGAEPPREDERLTLEQAITLLPAQHQAALALFYKEGMRTAEISVALDVPLGTVKSRLSHARSNLRTILERE